MEIRHLRYFVAVAEHLHFGEAARALNTAQPSLSQQIRRLEAELGVELLERDRHSVSLTAAGYAFLHEAREIIVRAERSVAIAREVAAGRIGQVRLACGPGTFGIRLSGALRNFSLEHPGVSIDATILSDTASIEALVRERVDVALVYELPRGEARTHFLTGVRFAIDTLAVAAPRSHALAAGHIALNDLRGSRLLLCSAESYPSLNRTLREVYAGLSDEPPVIQDVDDPVALLGLIAAGFGVAIVPREWGHLAPETVRLSSIEGPIPEVVLGAYRRSDRRNAALDAFEPYLIDN
jgi:DNA-binding transcriptional LysR family regulator